MKITKIINKIAQENTYLLSNSSTIIVIDPGSDSDEILEKIHQIDLPVSAILLTHAHFDHIMGISAIQSEFPDVKIYVHEAEKFWLSNSELNAGQFFLRQNITAPNATNFYEFDKTYHLTGFEFQVRQTPGHSPGGVSLVFNHEKIVFTGDALFNNSIGRTDLTDGNLETLQNAIKTQLFTLPNDYDVFPGHGNSTTIGAEKMYNPFL